MTPRKRSLIRRLFGLKDDEATERRSRERVAKAEHMNRAADIKGREQAASVQRARKRTHDSADRVLEQTCSLSGMLEGKNGKTIAELAAEELERKAQA